MADRRCRAGRWVVALLCVVAGLVLCGCVATVGGTGSPAVGAGPSGLSASSASPAPSGPAASGTPSGAGPTTVPADVAPLRADVCNGLTLTSVSDFGQGDYDDVQPAGGCVLTVYDADGNDVAYVYAQLLPPADLPPHATATVSESSGLRVYTFNRIGDHCEAYVAAADRVLDVYAAGDLDDKVGYPQACGLASSVVPDLAHALATGTFGARAVAASSIVDADVCGAMDQAPLSRIAGVGAALVTSESFGSYCRAAGPRYRVAVELDFTTTTDQSDQPHQLSTDGHELEMFDGDCSDQACAVTSVQGATGSRTHETLQFVTYAVDGGVAGERSALRTAVLSFAGLLLDQLGRR